MKIMKRIITLGVFWMAIAMPAVLCQNLPPVVSNVSFSQRTDGSFLVDIYYDVNDPEGDPLTVSLKVSDDNGYSWDFACTQLSGSVGAGQGSGTGKHIVWNYKAEHPNTFGMQYRIMVIASDSYGSPGQPCPGLASFTYGGQTYTTRQIGPQCWMGENLNIGNKIYPGQQAADNGIIEKYCYNNDDANCIIYGGLYSWNEMMQYSTAQGAQGICPNGWHIPTDAEWCAMLNYIDPLTICPGSSSIAGGKLKESGLGHWNSPNTGATNESGFTALGAGYGTSAGSFSNLKSSANFWSSTQYSSPNAYYYSLDYNYAYANRSSNSKTYRYSVRCLRDN